MRFIPSILLATSRATMIHDPYVHGFNPMVPGVQEPDLQTGFEKRPSVISQGAATAALEDLENTVRGFMEANPSINSIAQLTDTEKAKEFGRKYRSAMNLFWETIGMLDTIRVKHDAVIKGEKGPYIWNEKGSLTIRNDGCEYKSYGCGYGISLIARLPDAWLPQAPPCLSEPDEESVRSGVLPANYILQSATGALVPGHADWNDPNNMRVEIRCFLHTPWIPIPEVKMRTEKYTADINRLPKNFGLRRGWVRAIGFTHKEGLRLCSNVNSVLMRLHKQLRRIVSTVPKDMTYTKSFFGTQLPSRDNIRNLLLIPVLAPCNRSLCMKETSRKISPEYTDNILVVAQKDIGGFVVRMLHRWVFAGNPTNMDAEMRTVFYKIYNSHGMASTYVDRAMAFLDVPRIIDSLEVAVTHRYDPNFGVHICSIDTNDIGEVSGHEPQAQCHRLVALFRSTLEHQTTV